MTIMSQTKRLYNRLDGWARNLSRIRYAAFVGVVSFSCYLFGGALLGKSNIFGAFGIGFTLAALHFAFNPNAQT